MKRFTRAELIVRDNGRLEDMHIVHDGYFVKNGALFDKFVILFQDQKRDTITLKRPVDEINNDIDMAEYREKVLRSWLGFIPDEKDCMTCERRGKDCLEYPKRLTRSFDYITEAVNTAYLPDEIKEEILDDINKRLDEAGVSGIVGRKDEDEDDSKDDAEVNASAKETDDAGNADEKKSNSSVSTWQ